MKSALDPRHKKRRKTVKELFALSFTKQKSSALVREIMKLRLKIDKKIIIAAPSWPIEKINKIDLAILRLAVFELIKGGTPLKVVIDEAIELSKEYGSENSPAFVNGVLGTIIKQ